MKAVQRVLCIVAGATAVWVGVAQGQVAIPKPELRTVADASGIHAGSSIRLALQVGFPDGVHVQSDRPRDPGLTPTALSIAPAAGIKVSEVVYPPAIDFVLTGIEPPLAVFEQRFVVGIKLTV